jgi:RNA polymerase subunit RPABC4/transcription elongation factor Spt4
MTNQADQGRSNLAVVVLIVAIGFVLLFAASGSMLGFVRWAPLGNFISLRPFAFHGILPLGLMSVIHIILAVWVGIDANRRGQNGILWGLLVLFTSLIGLIVYLLISPMIASRSFLPNRIGGPAAPETPQVGGAACPSCHAEVQADFRICPRCGATLARCGQCDKSIRPDWKVCPYCGTPVAG